MAYLQPLTGQITGNGQSIVIEDLSGISTVALHLSGTWVADLNPEISLNGTTWVSVRGSSSSGASSRVQFTSSASNNSLWTFNVPGAQKFRIRSVAYTSGTVDIVISGLDAGQPQLPITEITSVETAGANPPVVEVAAIPVAWDGATAYQRAQTAASVHDTTGTGLIASGPMLKALSYGTTPTAVAQNDFSVPYGDRHGVAFVIGGHPDVIALRANYTAAQTDTAIVTVSAGSRIVVTQVAVTADNANTVDVQARIGFGAATTPTTTGVVLTHPGIAPGSGYSRGSGDGILGVGADGEDLRITSEVPTGGSVDALVTYYVVTT